MVWLGLVWNSLQARRTAIEPGRLAEDCKGRGSGALSRKIFEKLVGQILHPGHIWHCFEYNYAFAFHAKGGATHNYTRSMWYAMSQVSDTCEQSTHVGSDTKRIRKLEGYNSDLRLASYIHDVWAS